MGAAMNKCRLCQSTDIRQVLDLGYHPLADRFLTAAMMREPEVRYPLTLELCSACGYVGNGYVVPAKDRYQVDDYSYTAGNSAVSREHFAELAKSIVESCGALRNVLDIGGNDGTLLKAIIAASRDRWSRVFHFESVVNVEPSANIAKLCDSVEISVIQHLWGSPRESRAGGSCTGSGIRDLIVCTNVMNHASDPDAFIEEVADALKPGGWFVVEVPWLETMLDRGAFDTIYHEHISYFGMKPLLAAFERHGMKVIRFGTNDYMGGSMRMFVRKRPFQYDRENVFLPKESTQTYELLEYARLEARMHKLRDRIWTKIDDARRERMDVFAIGAAAKGNTLLNYCGLDSRTIVGVVDTSPHKIGKWTPGSHIPIIDDAVLEANAAYALVLPWNISRHIYDRYKANPNLTFLIPSVVAAEQVVYL